MKKYTQVHSESLPTVYVSNSTHVFIAENIAPYEKQIEDNVVQGYEYDVIEYTKDEYLNVLREQNNQLQQELLDTQAALCDVYETLEGLING